jgi:hypothetical protein
VSLCSMRHLSAEAISDPSREKASAIGPPKSDVSQKNGDPYGRRTTSFGLSLFPMSYFHVQTTPIQAPNMTIVAIQPVVLR